MSVCSAINTHIARWKERARAYVSMSVCVVLCGRGRKRNILCVSKVRRHNCDARLERCSAAGRQWRSGEHIPYYVRPPICSALLFAVSAVAVCCSCVVACVRALFRSYCVVCTRSQARCGCRLDLCATASQALQSVTERFVMIRSYTRMSAPIIYSMGMLCWLDMTWSVIRYTSGNHYWH